MLPCESEAEAPAIPANEPCTPSLFRDLKAAMEKAKQAGRAAARVISSRASFLSLETVPP